MFSHIKELFTTPSGYTIGKSVRLRSSATAYLNRTPASASNRKTWTWSGWVKRGILGANQVLMSSDVGTSVNTWLEIGFTSADALQVTSYTGQRNTTAIYRDPSAWYHIVVAFDTTQAVEVDRIKFYVNGVLNAQTGDAGFPAQNTDYGINNNQIHAIGERNWASGVGRYFDGYLTEINFIDGQALTPSSFGSTNALTGVWQPAKYTGTYGTNGFYLNFSDNSSNTATTIGKDYSGNGNNWTPNNISVTAGATYDSMVDSPTVSAVSSNYAVWNPLKATAGTYSNANLSVLRSGAANVDLPVSTLQIPKTVPIYCEFSFGNQDSSYGIAKDTSNSGVNGIVGSSTDGASYGAYITTSSTYYGFWNNNSRTSFDFSGGTIYQMAFDQANGKLWFGKDGTWYNSGNPANGTNPTFSSISTTNDFFVAALATTSACSVNFGQRPFTYTPPTGFVALNTWNLPDSTIKNGAAYMAATLYSANNGTQTITNTVNGVSFQPDFIWTKSRSNAYGALIYDSIRGVGNFLQPASTAAESNNATTLISINSNGYTVGSNDNSNLNTGSSVGWQWKAGGTSSSNTNGSITSTVSVGATQGFSVVTYTGTGANATVGHGLGVAPSMIILKQRNAVDYWVVWQTTLGSTGYLLLNSTNGSSTAATYWNSTTPTSTVFSLGSDSRPNGSGTTYVAYCFAAVKGFSAFGSYTGNGSADGPFVFTGFQPRWVMIKRTDSSPYNWVIGDTSRNTYNVANAQLSANLSDAENTSYMLIDFVSNGFKLRTTDGAYNASGGTYVYACFASNPFKNALAR